MTNLPKIEKCVCGRRALVCDNPHGEWFVYCPRDLCWCGPARNTKRGAINAWNRVMNAVRNPDGLTEAYMAGRYDGRHAKAACKEGE